MEFIGRNWFKICIIVILVIGAVSFQKSYDRGINMKADAEASSRVAKENNDKRDYINKRKSDCYETYNKEKKNWNNAQGPAYDEEDDICRVTYKSSTYWKGVTCESQLPTADDTSPNFRRYARRQYLLCLDGDFEKDF